MFEFVSVTEAVLFVFITRTEAPKATPLPPTLTPTLPATFTVFALLPD